MKVLLDEDVPVQLLDPLRRLLPEHEVQHVDELGWKGKKDLFLLPDAAAKGYAALVTNDSGQLNSPEESRAIRDSSMHHIRYTLPRGLDGLAVAMGSVMAAMRPIMKELVSADGQRLVLIQSIQPGKRHTTTDPQLDPPPYWPSRRHPARKSRP